MRNRNIFKQFYLILLASALLFSCKVTQFSQQERETEEYLVYSKVINHDFAKDFIEKAIIIYEQTVMFPLIDQTCLDPTIEQSQKYRHYLGELASMGQDTLHDYSKVNNLSYRLKSRFHLIRKCIFFSVEDYDRIFRKKGDGWKKFHAEHPKSFGFYNLSKVGFNRKMNKALVYMSHRIESAFGYGHFYFLIKKSGFWEIEKVIFLWVS